MLNIPKINRKEVAENFHKHTIVKAILRLDFNDVFDAKQIASQTVSKLGKKYSISTEEKDVLLKASNFSLIPIKEITSYILKDPLTDNSIKINSTSIILEYNKYTNFDEMLKTFDVIFKVYNEIFPNNALIRAGIRKINMYHKNENKSLQSFNKYFNKFLLSSLNKNIFDINLEQNINTFKTIDNNLNIIVQYGSQKGIINNKNARRFILDFDCFVTSDIFSDNINNIFVTINNKIFDIYYWCIGDKLKKELSI